MGVPTIVSTSPLTGASSVYKNRALTVTFSEDLLATSVSQATFLLKNLDSNQLVPVDVSVSGAIVTVTPIRHLAGSTSYRLTIVGANTAVGTPIQSSTDNFATTTFVVFTTNDEIEVVAPQKTDAEKLLEGEIDLPESWIINVDSSQLEITGSTPTNRDFGVDPELDEIIVYFNADLDTSTVTDETFIVSVEPYYEEDEEFLAFPDTSDGSMNFQWANPTDDDGEDLDFSDISGTVRAQGNAISWTRDGVRTFPRNTKIKLTLKSDIASLGGSTLDGNYEMSFFIKPFPDLVSVDRIRDEFYPYKLTAWTDDMIGKTIYKNSLDALALTRYQYDFRNRNRTMAQYVIASTVFDICAGLKFEEDLLAGQFKRLGDLVVRYDVGASSSMPLKMIQAKKNMEDLKDALRGRFTKAVLPVVKGKFHPEQKAVWRTRLWHSDISHALEEHYAGSKVGANTGDERATKAPGAYDRW